MSTKLFQTAPSPSQELAQVVEPLASYICAAEHPRKVLLSVLQTLLDEVRQTNQIAVVHFSTLRDSDLGLAV